MLRPGDRVQLEATVRMGTVETRAARRARIVLLAAEGWSNRDIAERVGMHYNQVGVWRKRYGEFGLAGLLDNERPGRPHVYDRDHVLLLVKQLTEPPPESATRWTKEALAKAMATHGVPMSASQAWRICKALDLKPWQGESWMTSHDPDFWEKASDVCGVYLDPPQNAVVWSVDEKSGMQAKSRTNPTKPAIPGKPVSREYKRNGTAVLFAALEIHDDGVAGWVTESTKAENFVGFLADLVRLTPKELELHCIADNLSAHKTDGITAFLAANPHVHVHYTPSHANWLNQVELFFSILERRQLCRGEFAPTDELAHRITAFIKDYNRRAAPYRWIYDALAGTSGSCEDSQQRLAEHEA
jgi:transposase